MGARSARQLVAEGADDDNLTVSLQARRRLLAPSQMSKLDGLAPRPIHTAWASRAGMALCLFLVRRGFVLTRLRGSIIGSCCSLGLISGFDSIPF